MLVFFTDPYPDELLFSAISRYHYYVGNYSNKDTFIEMCGISKQCIPESIKYFGYNLEHLVEELGGTYSIDELINNHTLFSVYKPFLIEDAIKDAINSMIKSDMGFGKINTFNKIKNSKNALCFCSKCAKEDIEKYGQPYFHRIHQLKGISVCPIHKLPLKKHFEKDCNITNPIIRIDKNKVDLKDELIIVNETYLKLCKLSELSYELFSNDVSKINKQKLCRFYKILLNKKGLISKSGQIRQKMLKGEFINYYGKDFLVQLDSYIDMNVKLSWIDYIFYEDYRFVHPISHLLLINFLGKTIAEIINDIDETYYPCRKGPWPCMNKLCKCYKKDVIKSLEIEVKSYGKPIGIFKCDTCGLSYSRFLSTDNDNKYEVLKILDYGVLWTKILEEYLKSGQYSLYEISKMMGCSYNTIYNTKQLDIKKFKEVKNFDSKVLNESKKVLINELDLNQNLLKKDLKNIHLKEYQYIYNHEPEWLKSLPSKHNPYKDSEEKLKVYKKELLEVMHENPNITTSELFGKINSRLYYIKDHDPTWWKENIQVSESKQIKGEEKIDWQKRDKDLLKSLLNKYEEINNRNEVTRITFSLLQREVFEICFNSDNLKKMPNSKAYIESIIDTTQSYRMKSYKRFIDKKLENDTSFTVNDIPKDFLYFNKQDESVKRELEDYIFNLKNKLKIL